MRKQLLGGSSAAGYALAVLLAITLTASSPPAASAPPIPSSPSLDAAKRGEDADATSTLIVKFEPSKTIGLSAIASRDGGVALANAVASRFGATLSHDRTLATGAELLRLDQAISIFDASALAAALARDPSVRYAVANRSIRTQQIPNDPQFADVGQWGFKYSPGSIEGANFVGAWDITTGAAAQTIGIVDGGVARAHEELAPQLRVHPAFPLGGYDFINEALISGDGDGRDNDPTDTTANCGHGTHVAGTIAAETSFGGGRLGVGVAGGASSSKLLIARALNSFGSDADAIDAMLWLAGVAVSGVAINPNPVRMINMSFGGGGACGGAYQDAFDALRARGVLPVVAAGNSAADVSSSAPANCRGALAVAASDITGSLASFSNFGVGIAVTAPGVNILSTSGPLSGACTKSGTSMAAPHVTAAAALLQAKQPTLTVNQTQLAVRAGARAFPADSNCTAALCGAGLLDVGNSLDAVLGSVARIGWNEQAATLRENDGTVSFTVSRIGGLTQPASVAVIADNGTALAGVDFSPPSPATLNWAANDASDRTVTVPIIYRAGEQGVRAFSLRLNSPSGSTVVVAPAAVSVRITEVDCATVTPIAMGETKSGLLDLAHPENYCHGGVRGPEFNTVRYSFNAVAGDVVSIDVTSTTAAPPVLDPYLYLLGPNREILAENDDIVSSKIRDSRIQQFRLTTTGTHYIDVTTWGSSADATGTYDVRLYGCGPYVAGATCNLDVDGDGIVDLTDAQLVLRRLLGFSGASLTASTTFRNCASRTTGANIAAFVDAQRLPVSNAIPFDIDGDGFVLPTTDGLMLLRAALGLSADAVVASATALGAPRRTWAAVRGHLNDVCAMGLP